MSQSSPLVLGEALQNSDYELQESFQQEQQQADR